MKKEYSAGVNGKEQAEKTAQARLPQEADDEAVGQLSEAELESLAGGLGGDEWIPLSQFIN